MTTARRVALLTLCALAALLPLNGLTAGRAQPPAAITIGTTDLPRSLDPGDTVDLAAWEVLSHLYTGLTRQVPGSTEYELALASNVTISDDGLTYTFTLRRDAAFADGTPITAEDFVASIERVLALRRPAADAVEPYVAQVAADDAGRLTFTLKRPVPYFLALLALPPYYAVHPTLAGSDRPDPFARLGLIGSGPYRLERYEVGRAIVLTENDAFRFGPLPVTPRIELRQFAFARDLREALRRREVDLAWRALAPADLDRLAAVAGIEQYTAPGTRAYYLVMNQRREPTDDPLVREAIIRLLEREEAAAQVFGGQLAPLTSLVPDLFPEAYAPLWPDEPDVPAAEAVLRAAGYSHRGTSRLSFSLTTSRYLYGDRLVAGLRQLIRASFRGTNFVLGSVRGEVVGGDFMRDVRSGTLSAAVIGWTPLVPHPLAYLEPLAHSREPIPSANGYASPALDALLDEAVSSRDPARLRAIYTELAQTLLDDYALAPLWQDSHILAAWGDVTGILIEPNGLLHYDRLGRTGQP